LAVDDPEAAAPRFIGKREARRRQAVYAAKRRDWSEALGRAYPTHNDPRPPPGELDAEAEGDE
jgi:hypothetical protein